MFDRLDLILAIVCAAVILFIYLCYAAVCIIPNLLLIGIVYLINFLGKLAHKGSAPTLARSMKTARQLTSIIGFAIIVCLNWFLLVRLPSFGAFGNSISGDAIYADSSMLAFFCYRYAAYFLAGIFTAKKLYKENGLLNFLQDSDFPYLPFLAGLLIFAIVASVCQTPLPTL